MMMVQIPTETETEIETEKDLKRGKTANIRLYVFNIIFSMIFEFSMLM